MALASGKSSISIGKKTRFNPCITSPRSSENFLISSEMFHKQSTMEIFKAKMRAKSPALIVWLLSPVINHQRQKHWKMTNDMA